jgi:hypothetical protein
MTRLDFAVPAFTGSLYVHLHLRNRENGILARFFSD